ncbi:MAG: TerB family tellurite resistance protein [Gammaproteobacteria bacterium]|nr:TerB family tellurite resistance protein [Gammaproteobacteria bacterium]
MSTFSFLRNIFGGEESLSGEEQTKLFEEMLFLTLSRASRSDLDISEVEIARIQQILKEAAGIEATEQEIRTAGMSELYEVAPLEKYAAKAAKGLNVKQRHTIVQALYDVIGVDGKVSLTEANFFDSIAGAMNLKPIEMMGAEVDQ